MGKPTDNLTPADRQLLAREMAADEYSRWEDNRRDFRAGCDAALEWVERQASEGIVRLDNESESRTGEGDGLGRKA